jgi:hypothetical protein
VTHSRVLYAHGTAHEAVGPSSTKRGIGGTQLRPPSCAQDKEVWVTGARQETGTHIGSRCTSLRTQGHQQLCVD